MRLHKLRCKLRYCVVEVANKPYTRMQTGVLQAAFRKAYEFILNGTSLPAFQGAQPAWDYTGVVQDFAFGDVLKFAVYRKDLGVLRVSMALYQYMSNRKFQPSADSWQ